MSSRRDFDLFIRRPCEPYLAWGTPGGDQQDQWSLLLFLRHVHHGLNLQEAIEAPAFHSEHWPSSFWPRQARPNVLLLEGQFERDTIRDLKRRGHDVIVGEPWSEGRLSACSRELRDGTLYLRAGATPAACRVTRSAADQASGSRAA